MRRRKREADAFYTALAPAATADEALVMRQAFAGMLWSKQFYNYDVERWLEGDPDQPPPPSSRRRGRNARPGSDPWTPAMSKSLVDKVAEAILYEGYILYPYRASSPKNRERFTFGS